MESVVLSDSDAKALALLRGYLRLHDSPVQSSKISTAIIHLLILPQLDRHALVITIVIWSSVHAELTYRQVLGVKGAVSAPLVASFDRVDALSRRSKRVLGEFLSEVGASGSPRARPILHNRVSCGATRCVVTTIIMIWGLHGRYRQEVTALLCKSPKVPRGGIPSAAAAIIAVVVLTFGAAASRKATPIAPPLDFGLPGRAVSPGLTRLWSAT